MDLLAREDEIVPDQVAKDNRRLWVAGIAAIAGGAGLLAVSNLGLYADAWPYCLAAAVVGVGLGSLRLLKRVFRKNTLSLPPLELRRKTERVNQNAMNTFGLGRRSWSLAKSAKDSVIMGVCGGLAEQTGIPATLIRALWIIAFAVTGGIASLFYIGLGLILPTRKP
jgi:phage shock protein PspC (stress-responsive transcriptional regulator)